MLSTFCNFNISRYCSNYWLQNPSMGSTSCAAGRALPRQLRIWFWALRHASTCPFEIYQLNSRPELCQSWLPDAFVSLEIFTKLSKLCLHGYATPTSLRSLAEKVWNVIKIEGLEMSKKFCTCLNWANFLLGELLPKLFFSLAAFVFAQININLSQTKSYLPQNAAPPHSRKRQTNKMFRRRFKWFLVLAICYLHRLNLM